MAKPLIPNPISKKTDYYIAGGAVAAGLLAAALLYKRQTPALPPANTCATYDLYRGPVAPGTPVGDEASRILAGYYAGAYKMGDVVIETLSGIGTIRFLVTMHGPNPQNPQSHPGVSAFLCA